MCDVSSSFRSPISAWMPSNLNTTGIAGTITNSSLPQSASSWASSIADTASSIGSWLSAYIPNMGTALSAAGIASVATVAGLYIVGKARQRKYRASSTGVSDDDESQEKTIPPTKEDGRQLKRRGFRVMNGRRGKRR